MSNWQKIKYWMIANGIANEDGEDRSTFKMPGANAYEIYKNLNNNDIQSINNALNQQHAYEKAVVPNKGKVAAATLAMTIAPEIAPWLILAAEDVNDIMGVAKEGRKYNYPTSTPGYINIMQDPTSSFDDKVTATTNYGLTWAGNLLGLKPTINYITAAQGHKEAAKRFGQFVGTAAASLPLALGTAYTLGKTGVYDKYPVASEFALQSMQYIPYLSPLYKKGINTIAAKTHKYKPTITDNDGNVIAQPSHIMEETTPKTFKYIGEQYGSAPTKKSVWTKLGADPILQDNSKLVVHRTNGSTDIFDFSTGQKSHVPNFSSVLKYNLLQ